MRNDFRAGKYPAENLNALTGLKGDFRQGERVWIVRGIQAGRRGVIAGVQDHAGLLQRYLVEMDPSGENNKRKRQVVLGVDIVREPDVPQEAWTAAGVAIAQVIAKYILDEAEKIWRRFLESEGLEGGVDGDR